MKFNRQIDEDRSFHPFAGCGVQRKIVAEVIKKEDTAMCVENA